MVDQPIAFAPAAVVDAARGLATAGIRQNDASLAALLALGRTLQARDYDFVTPAPLTHSRVNARPENAAARTLRDFFGWSRSGPAALIPSPLPELMRRAGILEEMRDLVASRLRFSTLQGLLFAHSRYPTVAADAVFFGPDTYRFAALIGRVLDGCASAPRAILDLGCGSGAGGIVAARRAGERPFLVLADINPAALRLARVNAALADVDAAFLAADLLTALSAAPRGKFDLIVANPPYLADPAQRLYRDGGGPLGGALSLRILREGIAHLAPGGRLVLYTGSAIVDGRDLFREQAIEIVGAAGLADDYAEIDPDVFGEELEAGPYRRADRIAAVSLVVRDPAWEETMSSSPIRAAGRHPVLPPTGAAAGHSAPAIDPRTMPKTLHRRLAHFNEKRLCPALGSADWRADLGEEFEMKALEAGFVERERELVTPRAAAAPEHPDGFVAWFESLRENGPGQGDPLFPWLAETASMAEMRWFIAQEIGGEAGFDDLVALTQIRLPVAAKLELARNYWDEMGRGDARGMHGPMLTRIGAALGVTATVDGTVWEALALTNMMVALAANRRYAYQSIGALGVIEMTAPGRVALVDRGLDRLGLPKKARHYFSLHAVLDVQHSAAWNREILRSLVAAEPRAARPIGEGALLRLRCGGRCFRRYRLEFGLGDGQSPNM